MTRVAYCPPSLREFLDSGADFTSIPDLDIDYLATSICIENRGQRPSARSRCAETMRLVVEYLKAGKSLIPYKPRVVDGVTELPPKRDDYGSPGHIASVQWEADAYEAPELVARLEQALPDPIRHKVRREWDLRQHPHPLVVEDVAETCCEACGDWFAGPAVRVGVREGYSDDALDYPLVYCAPCVRIAAASLGDRDVVVIP
jgi:hypothetical protein